MQKKLRQHIHFKQTSSLQTTIILSYDDGQVQVVERQQEINIQQQEIMKKEKELDSKVNNCDNY